MKILLFEYFTGSTSEMSLDNALCDEGDLMLNALGRDLQKIPQIDLVVLRNQRLSQLNFDATVVPVQFGDDYQGILRSLLSQCDAFIPIAPETDCVLEQLCCLSERVGCQLLSSNSAIVAVTSSKLQTTKILQQAGIASIKTVPYRQAMPIEGSLSALPIILKPDDGVGCQGQYIIDTAEQLTCLPLEIEAQLTQSSKTGYYVAQPYLLGQAASLSVMYCSSETRLLAANIQCIEREGNALSLRGCEINALNREGLHLEQLVRDIHCAMPGLVGYVGIDFLVHRGKTIVLEINPRLTRSYVGLADITGVNPAELIVSLAR